MTIIADATWKKLNTDGELTLFLTNNDKILVRTDTDPTSRGIYYSFGNHPLLTSKEIWIKSATDEPMEITYENFI